MPRHPSRSLCVTAALLLGGLPNAARADPTAAKAQPQYTNALIHSADPYLLEHAHNPVDWYPWGPEAFAKAKAENKPIFLSIGYSTCYWCHVAEKTIYSNPAIAALMNKWFVNIKVDREQRPDIDRLYIIATQMLTQHGAWPNNVFLTPDLKPFFAGSYFPPADQADGTPGFPKVLAAIHDLWINHRAEKIDPAADELFDALQQVAGDQADSGTSAIDPKAWLARASDTLLARQDFANGGFGGDGPKFPQAPALALLLADARSNPQARKALSDALDAIAYGGIHDQIGGGLHRYATEPTWSIPHFEKMLYDNAQFLKLYAKTFALTKAPRDRVFAEDIASYLERDMMAPKGGFYTAQDAEVAGVEGGSYLWTRPEIESVLGEKDTDRFLEVYDLVAMPDATAPDGRPPNSVLRLRLPIDDTLKRAGYTDVPAMLAALAPERAKLLAARQERRQPARDDKIVTSLNGLAIGAFARAGLDLDRPDYVDVARKAGERIWAGAYDAESGELHHQIFAGKAEGAGYLEDYAMLGDAFLTLADATREGRWRGRAETLGDVIVTHFLEADGRLKTGDDEDALPIALEDSEDSDVPSGTSAALALLARLGADPGGARFQIAAAKIVTHLSGRIAASPQSWPSAIVALVEHPLSEASLADAKVALAKVALAKTANAKTANAKTANAKTANAKTANVKTAKTKPAPAKVASTGAVPLPAAPSNGSSPAVRASSVPSTSDHVHASAKVEGDTIAVTLAVDDGFHINAHKPSLDYLVPTDLSFVGLTPSSIAYPPGRPFKSAFAKDSLDVYEGDVALVAIFPKDALSGVMAVAAKVTAQACDSQTCLPPATLDVTAANP